MARLESSMVSHGELGRGGKRESRGRGRGCLLCTMERREGAPWGKCNALFSQRKKTLEIIYLNK
jgi:hypothetical protein